MKPAVKQAHSAAQKAREALRNNQRGQARQWAEQAAKLAPQLEDPWLILAAVASPRLSLEYIQRALKVNPNSLRARRGMEWALERLREAEPATAETQKSRAIAPGLTPRRVGEPEARGESPNRSRRYPIFPIALLVLGCLVFAAAGWTASTSPAVASILPQGILGAPTNEPPWAEASIPKPTDTPESPLIENLVETATPTLEPAESPTEDLSNPAASETVATAESPTEQPTEIEGELPTATSEPESNPPTAEPTWAGSLTLQYVPDTPTAEVPPNNPAATSAAPGPLAGSGTRWIDVNLSRQTVYVYEGDALVNSFLVSTGTWKYPTVTGQYHIYVKLRYTDMTGPDYYVPNVPYTMYFYKGYALHGTYWHHNFGTPMSHGCVNLSVPDAAWLFDFASVGTLVNVHY
jgi:lipoprotein-anchoring transpeptidase ErfK/SrfK